MKREQMVKARNIAIGAVAATALLIGGLASTSGITQEKRIEGVDITQVYAGQNTTFVLDKDGLLWGKGLNNVGQLGAGDSINKTEWSPITFGENLKTSKASIGKTHGAVLTETDEIYTFGDNRTGVYGNGSKGVNLLPGKVSASFTYKLLAAGENFTVALDTNNILYAWGDNKYGQLGVGDKEPRTVPTVVPFAGGTITSLKAGKDFVVALTENGEVFTWGANDSGQLGVGDNSSRDVPSKVNDLPRVTFINTNLTAKSVAALTENGELHMWGSNATGQLGIGIDWRQQIEDEKQRVVNEIEQAKQADEERKETLVKECVVKADEKWEKENPPVWKKTGEKKKPKPPVTTPPKTETTPTTPTDEEEPVKPSDEEEEEELEEIWEWVQPDKPDHRPKCVTDVEKDFKPTDTSGIKERKITEPKLLPNMNKPVRVADAINFSYVSTGAKNSAAVGLDGRLYSWGSDKDGQNGNNIDDDKSHTQVPVAISPDTWDAHRYVQTEVADGWSVAVSNMNVMQAWGASNSNALAGAGKQSNIPVNVGEEVDRVYVNSQTGYYVGTDNRLYSWGSNRDGLLGVDIASSSTATFNHVASGVSNVAPTSSSVIALKDNLLYGWGTDKSNTFGEDSKDDNISKTMRRIQEITKFVDVSAGNRFSLAVDEDGRVWMWGADSNKVSLNSSSAGNILYPVPVPLTHLVSKIFATDDGAYALTSDNKVIAWGSGRGVTEWELPGTGEHSFFSAAHQLAVLDETGLLFVTSTQPARSILVDDDETGESFVQIPGKYETVSSSLTDEMIAMNKDGSFITWGAFDQDDEAKQIQDEYNIFEMDLLLRNTTEISISQSHYVAFDKNKILWMWGEEPAGSFGDKGRIKNPSSSIFSPERKEVND